MSDTTPCSHHQFVGQREFCPDCGLSRTEALVEACAPFLKDDETPAECIRRNRKDVDGCLTMLIDERRKNEALRAERDEAERRAGEMESRYDRLTVDYAKRCAERDEAVALLKEVRSSFGFVDDLLHIRIDAFLAKLEAKP